MNPWQLPSTPATPPPPEVNPGHRTTPDGPGGGGGRPYAVAVGRVVFIATPEGGWSPPVLREDVPATLRRLWPRTDDRPALRLTVPNARGDGERPMKPPEILERFGRTAGGVVYSYIGARYDYASDTVYLGVAPERPVAPAHSPDVEAYLAIVGGQRTPKLLDWLATYRRLEHPTAALALTGPAFAGKSTILHALAVPWGRWADLGLVLGDFQDGAKQSPLWAADEGLALPSKKGTIRLREAITARDITINPKGQPAGRLEGSPRLVLASNDIDPFKFGAELFNDDSAKAIASRILHFALPAEASRFLLAHPGIAPATLAAHFAWLADTRRVEPGGRLLVEGDADAFVEQAASETPAALEVYARICHLLDSPAGAGFFGGVPPVSESEDGEFALVRTGLLADVWPKAPHSRTVAKALRAIGGEPTNDRARTWRVPLAALRAKNLS